MEEEEPWKHTKYTERETEEDEKIWISSDFPRTFSLLRETLRIQTHPISVIKKKNSKEMDILFTKSMRFVSFLCILLLFIARIAPGN